jgi:hypothetical protein
MNIRIHIDTLVLDHRPTGVTAMGFAQALQAHLIRLIEERGWPAALADVGRLPPSGLTDVPEPGCEMIPPRTATGVALALYGALNVPARSPDGAFKS